jgi:hypothetical protein
MMPMCKLEFPQLLQSATWSSSFRRSSGLPSPKVRPSTPIYATLTLFFLGGIHPGESQPLAVLKDPSLSVCQDGQVVNWDHHMPWVLHCGWRTSLFLTRLPHALPHIIPHILLGVKF